VHAGRGETEADAKALSHLLKAPAGKSMSKKEATNQEEKHAPSLLPHPEPFS
jgi:hypothetical protein